MGVEKDYTFGGADGSLSFTELFDGRSQLLVYHFMFGPDWDEGCPSCSFWADSFDGVGVHLAQRDVTLVCVSRAPFARLAAYQDRMGWAFSRFSSYGSDFNSTSVCRSRRRNRRPVAPTTSRTKIGCRTRLPASAR